MEDLKKFVFVTGILMASFWLLKFENSKKSEIAEIRRPKTTVPLINRLPKKRVSF